VVTTGVCLSTFTMPPLIGLLLEAGYPWRTVELIMACLVTTLIPLVYFVVSEPNPSHLGSVTSDLPRRMLSARHIVTERTFLGAMLAIIPLFILFNAIYYTLGLYLNTLGATPIQVSGIVGLAGFIAIVGVTAFGGLADRMSQWSLLAISTGVLAGAFLLVGTVKSYVVMLAVVPLLDFVIGGLSSLLPAIFAKHYGPLDFARVSGLSRPFFAISSFSPLLAGYLYEKSDNYQTVYLILLVFLPISFVGLALLRRPRRLVAEAVEPAA
jgi:MFS family permease